MSHNRDTNDDRRTWRAPISLDFEWRLVCLVDRILADRPELREPLERALRTEERG